MKPTHEILREINTATKYPSIPTYHTIDKGFLVEDQALIYPPGEPVIGTEKVDGCLMSETRISMVDGTRKKIIKVAVDDEVLGVDEYGQITATKVTNTFNNGPASEWMKIKGPRPNAGRGSSFFAVKCTPNHRFWLPALGTYRAAEELRVGDRVTVIRSELELAPCQSSVLLGKLLGDGYLHRTTSGSAAVSWGHRVTDAAYVDWTLRALGDIANPHIQTAISGYGTEMKRAHSTFHPAIAERFGSMITPSGKIVPEWVADALDPIALAFWYMDDGSLNTWEGQEDRASFATCGFTEDDCKVLLRGLSRLGIDGTVRRDGRNYLTIHLGAAAAERMFLLVAPYVPQVMQRKLPERYRGHDGWLPPTGASFRELLVEQTIEVIERDLQGVSSSRWDIETETHNFFANGVLVHNSNARMIFLPNGEYLIGSREELLYAGGDIVHNPSQGIVDAIEGIARNVYDVIDGGSDTITVVYGEVYGYKITGASKNYTQKPGTVGFRVFDVAEIHDADWTLSNTLEWISGERDRQTLQYWWTEEELQSFAITSQLELTPRLFTVTEQLPTTLVDMESFLRVCLPRTRVGLDDTGQGKPEGIVLRTSDRRVISKARFEDYRKTFQKMSRDGAVR